MNLQSTVLENPMNKYLKSEIEPSTTKYSRPQRRMSQKEEMAAMDESLKSSTKRRGSELESPLFNPEPHTHDIKQVNLDKRDFTGLRDILKEEDKKLP